MSENSKAKALQAARPAVEAGQGLPLIGGAFRPDFSAPRADAGGGHSAFGVLDRQGNATELMAIAVERNARPRVGIIAALSAAPSPGLLNPVAFGAARNGTAAANYLICQAPPGPSLWTQASRPGRRLTELEIIETVLRPVAKTLETLAQRGFTHRGIRPDNLFSAGRGQPVILGAAWAAAPGFHQPPAYEPAYLAACHPHGRGEASIADDVYALGVTLLALALGEQPLRATEPETILRRKLDQGSFATLAEEARLSSSLHELLRGMLAEDPEHRPPPALLTNPAAARGRRLAARPQRRGQRPFEIGGIAAWNPRTLALGMMRAPEEAALAMKTGAIDRWLRRMLEDPVLAQRLELAVNARAYDGIDPPQAAAMRLARATALLDPLLPFHWRGLVFWPEALGAVLSAETGREEAVRKIEQVIETESLICWGEIRGERCDLPLLRLEGRLWRTWLAGRGLVAQLPRVLYGLNPTMVCQSPLLEGGFVTSLAQLLPELDRLAARPEKRQGVPADRHILCFIAAHSEHRFDKELAAFASVSADDLPFALLRLYGGVQAGQGALPNLAQWLAALCAGRAEQWHGKANRARVAAALKQHAEAGLLRPILDLLEDGGGLAADRAEAERAAQTVARIDQELARIAEGRAAREAQARLMAHETVGAVALAGVAAGILFAWLG